MDNVGIVVEDMEAAVAFFAELGLEVAGKATIEGQWVDRIVGLAGVRSDIVVMRTPDGYSRIELTRFEKPAVLKGAPDAPVNTIGAFRIMFSVSDIDETITRLKKYGARLVGEIVRYKDQYRLCYLRGPEGIVIALAEDLGGKS